MQAKTINTKWFKERLAERDMSMRRLAKLLKIDPSAVSLMLRGKRKITPQEANEISGLLTLPVTEVLRQAGIPVSDDTRDMRIKAFVDARSVLQMSTSKSPRRVNAPHDVPGAGMAVQVRAPDHATDGWVLFAGAPDNNPDAMIDRLCVVKVARDGHVVGTLKRGYDDSRYNVATYTGSAMLENVDVQSAAPVLWIRPV